MWFLLHYENSFTYNSANQRTAVTKADVVYWVISSLPFFRSLRSRLILVQETRLVEVADFLGEWKDLAARPHIMDLVQ